MEDLDRPRCRTEAADDILRSLVQHGLTWDETVLFQSQRSEHYTGALETLVKLGKVFRCYCTRKGLAGTPIYPGTCRVNRVQTGDPSIHLACKSAPDSSLRILVEDETIGFTDLIQGPYQQSLARDTGDFILRRRDGLFAYQLAVVVDDHQQNITRILRGADLLDNTPRQIYLCGQLGWPLPQYGHLPVILNRQGKKLSKQNLATAVQPAQATSNLLFCLGLLNQNPPVQLLGSTPGEVLTWAIEHWDLTQIPAGQTFPNVTAL